MSKQLRKFINRLNNAGNTAQNKFVIAFNERGNQIADLNRIRLGLGQLSTGEPIINRNSDEAAFGIPGYGPRHTEARGKRGRQTDYVDLRYDGNFYKSIKYKKNKKGGQVITTDSDDEKVGDIMDRYGEDVLGINEEDLQRITDDVANQIVNDIVLHLTDL